MRGGIVGVFLAIGLALAGTDNIVLTALTYMERPYQFGGNDLYRMDCSAFVKRVFEVNGISLPRSTQVQAQVGVQVGLEEIKPGDLLFFSTYRPGPSHVGIYIGNGKMIHASEKKGITIDRIEDPYWQKRFLFAKRVTKDNYVVKTYQKEEMQKNRDEIADLIFILSNR